MGEFFSYDLCINIGTGLSVILLGALMWKKQKKIKPVLVLLLAFALTTVLGKYLSTLMRQLAHMNFSDFQSLFEMMKENKGNHFLGRVFAIVLFYPALFFAFGKFLHVKNVKNALSDSIDGVAFFIVIQHFFSRLGCLMNGCCYGKPWSGFPGIILPYAEIAYRVFPVQIFEMLGMVILFLVLLWAYKKEKSRFPIALSGFGIIIFLSEFFMDQKGNFLLAGMNGIQYGALLLVMIACVIIFKEKGQKKS